MQKEFTLNVTREEYEKFKSDLDRLKIFHSKNEDVIYQCIYEYTPFDGTIKVKEIFTFKEQK